MTTTNASNPTDYALRRRVAEASTRWLKQMMHDDESGRYVAFSLNTRYRVATLLSGTETLRSKMERQAWSVANELHGLTQGDTVARLRDFGIFFFLLPATSSRGNEHYHGLVRIPAVDVPETDRWVSVNIKEGGRITPLMVPPVVADLLFPNSRQSGNSTFGDLHLRNDGIHVSFLDGQSFTTRSVLQYWMKESDGEVRHFSEGEVIPEEVRLALPIRQGRERQRTPSQRPRLSRAPAPSAPARRETVEEFLGRGGRVLVARPGPAPEPILPRHRRPRRASAGWNRRVKKPGKYESSLRLSWRN